MTPEEIALEAAKVELWKDAIKIGIPSLLAVISSSIAAFLAYRLKKVDEKIAQSERELKHNLSNLEAHYISRNSLLERKRIHIESASESYEKFVSSMAVYFTQLKTKFNKLEAGMPIPEEVENRISEYEQLTFSSYADSNKAKRILELQGCLDAANLLIEMMGLASDARNKYHQFCRKECSLSENDLSQMFSDFRKKGSDFLAELNICYESTTLPKESA